MTWLSALQLLLKLANGIAQYLHTNKLIDAGRSQAIVETTQEALLNVQKAQATTRTSDAGWLGRVRDKYRRSDDK